MIFGAGKKILLGGFWLFSPWKLGRDDPIWPTFFNIGGHCPPTRLANLDEWLIGDVTVRVSSVTQIVMFEDFFGNLRVIFVSLPYSCQSWWIFWYIFSHWFFDPNIEQLGCWVGKGRIIFRSFCRFSGGIATNSSEKRGQWIDPNCLVARRECLGVQVQQKSHLKMTKPC